MMNQTINNSAGGQRREPTKVQQRILELMDDIHEICVKKGLHYILFGKTAGMATAYGHFQEDEYNFEIMMPLLDAVKLRQYVEKNMSDTRAIESWEDNEALRQMVFRFVDKKSLLIDGTVGDYYCKPGVAVTIFVTRPSRADDANISAERYIQYLNSTGRKPKYSASDLKKMYECVQKKGVEAAIEEYHEPRIKEITRFAGGLRKGWIRCALTGKKRTARWILRQNIELAKKGGKEQIYVTRPGHRFAFSPKLYQNPGQVSFEGHTYWVAGDYEGYMKKMYGAKWKTRSVERYISGTERLRLICDTECPYEDYLEFLGEDKPVLKDIIMDRRDYTQWLNEIHSPLEEKALKDFLEIRRSVDRIDVWMMLRDRMEEIRQAGEREDLDSLRVLLEDYLERTDYFYSENIGFYINKELFSLASRLWEADGRTGYAEKVYALVPEHYRQDTVEDYLNHFWADEESADGSQCMASAWGENEYY